MIGSFWGEVNANTHRALGCVGTITDGAIRDLDEMTNAGFKAIARRLCVGSCIVIPSIGQAGSSLWKNSSTWAIDPCRQHGFLAIPDEDQDKLLEAAIFMDTNECQTVIQAARSVSGMTYPEALKKINQAGRDFGQAARDKFQRNGEW